MADAAPAADAPAPVESMQVAFAASSLGADDAGAASGASAEVAATSSTSSSLSSSPTLLGSTPSSPQIIHPSLMQQQRASTVASPSTREFRHSFVEIDHPLKAATNGANGVPTPIDEDAEQEEIIRRNQRAASLAHNKLAFTHIQEREEAAAARSVAAAAAAASAPAPLAIDPNGSASSSPTSPHPSVASNTQISMARLTKLLHFFIFSYSKDSGKHRNSARSLVIQQRLTQLCEIDYHISIIHNDSKNGAATNLAASTQAAAAAAGANGASASPPAALCAAADSSFEYCSSYPLELIIFENERKGPWGIDGEGVSSGSSRSSYGPHPRGLASPTLHSRINDSAVLKPLFRLSRFSRVHGRFVCPVILVHNKNICRSSTLANQAEAIFNNIHAKTKDILGSVWSTFGGFGAALSGGGGSASSNGAGGPAGASNPSTPNSHASPSSVVQVGLEGQRGHDIQLLQHVATSYIEDLMVEHRKKKLGVPLTSSEKNEEWRYGQMKLNALPYPGCEFFAEYTSNSHSGLGLLFNWHQSFISSDLLLSSPHPHVPDEMLSYNGTISPPAPGAHRKSQKQLGEEQQPWFEFQHSAEDHSAEREQRRKAESLASNAADSSVAASTADSSSSAAPAGVASPPILSPSVTPPPITAEGLIDEVIDHMLSHSASALSSEPMATHLVGANGESKSVGVVSSTSSGVSSSPSTPARSGLPLSPHPPSAAATYAAVAASANHDKVTAFSLYKTWDVVTLTKNYLLILMAHVADESPNSGVLVHCISGWDRTPLFISLLRLSLWADGECHRSLNAMQMLYLTLGYDWMGFGHHLHDRLQKGEDVMYFAFDFLQYITHTKFSLQTAIDMRSRKVIEQAELHIERSATPAPPTVASSSPVTSPMPAPMAAAPVRRTSALTSALQSQAEQPAAARKAASPEVQNGSSSSPPDDSPLSNDRSASHSPASLNSLPPVSSSFTVAKPTPSLASFIIEQHGSAQQVHTGHTPHDNNRRHLPSSQHAHGHTHSHSHGHHNTHQHTPILPSASASATPAASDSSNAPLSPFPSVSASVSASAQATPMGGPDEEEELEAPYVPSTTATTAVPTTAMAIPLRKQSSGGGSSSHSVAEPVAVAPIAASTDAPLLPPGSLDGFDQLSSSGGGASGGISSNSSSLVTGPNGTHMSRVNSWTLLSEKNTPPTTAALQAHHRMHGTKAAAGESLQPPHANGSSTAQARPASASTSAAFPYSTGPPGSAAAAAARAASARRCDRLLEVRALFLASYHAVLPKTAPASVPPHAHATSFAEEFAAAQKATANAVSQNGSNDATSAHASSVPVAATAAASSRVAKPAAAASNIAAPVAAPVRAQSSSWFSR